MSIIKRLSTTLVASIDQLVNEIENHDAVIQASLGEMRKKLATARVRQQQLQRESEALDRQARQLQAQAETWRERAVACAGEDESRALACLQHRRQCQQQAEQRLQESAQYQQAALALAQDITRSEQQCSEMTHRHRLLRARQTRAEATRSTQQGPDGDESLQEAFERWEIHIAQADCHAAYPAAVDPLDASFTEAEQQASLRAELAALMEGPRDAR